MNAALGGSEFPARFASAAALAARRLGAALDALDYPNGGRDATFAETNLVAYLVAGLLQSSPGFHCYAEAAHIQQRRIDLTGFDGRVAFALEAKKFGHVGKVVAALLGEMERIDQFVPRLSPTAEGHEPRDWWGTATERWAVLAVASHAGDEARKAWVALEHTESHEAQAGRSEWNDPRPIHGLVRELETRAHCVRDAAPICSGERWRNCADAWLLWAAYRLP